MGAAGDRRPRQEGGPLMAAPAIAATRLLRGATGDWEIVVGLEVHAQVTSKAKLFSGAPTDFGAPPNSEVSLVDAAMPGMLPVMNRECVAQAVRTGLGLQAKVNLVSRFRSQELLLPGSPAGLSDLAIPAADRWRGERCCRSADRRTVQRRHRAVAPGTGRRQIASRPERHHELRGPQSRRGRSHGNRHSAGYPFGR